MLSVMKQCENYKINLLSSNCSVELKLLSAIAVLQQKPTVQKFDFYSTFFFCISLN